MGTHLKLREKFLETGIRYLNPPEISFGRYLSGEMQNRPKCCRGHPQKIEKIDFFSIFQKLDINWFICWIFISKRFLKSPDLISGHRSSFRPISATLQEFEFLAKIDFFAILEIFNVSQYGRLFGRKWSEMWFLAGNGLFGSPKHFYIPYMIFHDD